MKLSLFGNQPIITPRDPVLPLEAANKNYVDNSIIIHSNNLSLHLTAAQNTLLDSLTVTAAELNQLAGVLVPVQSQLNAKLNLSGGILTGFLTLHANPVSNFEAATKIYVDTQVNTRVAVSGDIMTGFLTLHANPIANLHATTKQYVDSGLAAHATDSTLHITAAQNTLLDAITVSAASINHLDGVTSNVQAQLNARLNLAGGTLTGPLVLAADPVVALGATTRQYVDAGDALKVNRAGDTLTGFLVLHANPTLPLHAATRGYVDTSLTAHATDAALHITAAQNALIDAITVTATELNSLAGVASNVQAQINTKFDRAGGLITGDVTLDANRTIFISKVPVAATEVVNKSYVDSLLAGQKWEDPVTDINLIADNLNTPPATPVVNDVYIVGAAPIGAWLGLAGRAVFWNGGSWVSLQARPVAVNDRFGVSLTSATLPAGGLAALKGQLVTITNATPGAIQYRTDVIGPASTTLVFDPQSAHFGVSFTRTDEGNWVATNTSINIVAGSALSISGNILNFNHGRGLEVNADIAEVALEASGGLNFSESNRVQVALDGTTLTRSAAGTRLSDATIADIADRVSKTGVTSVTGTITIAPSGILRTTATPSLETDVVSKGYVDAADTAIQTQVTTLQTTVTALNADPVARSYVDAQIATRVAKAGDIMTGFLTLNADPTANLHAVTKQYVDSGLSAHATDAALHLTAAQNTFIDGITVSFAEVNHLAGVTDGVQAQLNAKLNLAGGTLTGPLVLAADPAAALGAATRQYVDAGDALKVNRAGDTLTGFLVLHANPTLPLHAATRGYVDTSLSAHATDAALHITAAQNALIDAITVSAAEINFLTGVTADVQTQLNARLNLAGGTMTGLLTLSGAPVTNLHAATKQYVDTVASLAVQKAGDTMTGFLTLHAAPTAALHAATRGYVDAEAATLNTTITTQTNTRVAKAGDTMTGFLTLHAAPTAALHAATKGYVDSSVATATSQAATGDAALQTQITALQSTVNTLNTDPVTKSYVDTQDNARLRLSGGTMTGYITLHADPQNALHPATKQYVDAVAQGLVTRPSIRLATTENLVGTYFNGALGVNATFTASANGALVVDGRTAAVGDRILLRLQTAALQNGSYTVQQVGDINTPFILRRVETADQSHEIPGSYFYVHDGATLTGTGWVLIVDNPVTFAIGTDAVTVNQFSGQGSIIAGTGLTLTGNTINVNTANPARIVVTADQIDLATTAVVPGTYLKVTTDGYGRITNGTNPTTIAGFGITDAQPLNANLTSLSTLATQGLVVRDSTNAIVSKAVTVTGVGLNITNGDGSAAGNIVINSNATATASPNTVVSRDASGNFAANTITAQLAGNAATATTLATSRQFSVTGDVTAPVVGFDGSANVALNATLVNTGVTAGTYTNVTVDAKGRVTAGSNPNTAAGHGIQDVYTRAEVDAITAQLRAEIAQLHLYIISRI